VLAARTIYRPRSNAGINRAPFSRVKNRLSSAFGQGTCRMRNVSQLWSEYYLCMSAVCRSGVN